MRPGRGSMADEPLLTVAHETLMDALAAGGTVVTATRRLARALHASYARRSAAPSWATPAVLPWSAWVQGTFAELRDFGVIAESPAVLDEWQSMALWEDVLAADPVAATLLMPGGAVEGFREAWSLAHQWRLPWATLRARGGEDCRIFLRVASAYRQRLDALDCLDAAQLPELLARVLAGRAGEKVLFAGFDRLHPAQQAVVQALGTRAQCVAAPARGGSPSLAAYPDSRHELAAAAAWARQRLEASPAARLGIVVPDLEGQAALLEDLLDESLVPARLLPGSGDAARPWNMSLGRPLVDAPVVAAAFLAFGLLREPLEFVDVSRLLRSPFIAGEAEEGGRRARLEAWLRDHAGDRISAAQLLAWLNGLDRAPGCPRLAAGIGGMLDELRSGPRRRRPSAWAAALSRGLARLGWPGDAPMDSPTWQTVQAWAGMLESFSRLDAVVGAIGLGDALARLRRIGAGERFQPETPEVPVQVLGLLEATGQEFDSLRVTGMHDATLPLPLRPCPLLPAALQRELQMPRACPDTELALARGTVARLAGAAQEVSFSFPETREDEPLRPSPVVAALAAPGHHLDASRAGVATAWFAARRLDSLADVHGPAIAGGVRGGTGLLAAQSACPFMAFAVHRLAAVPLEAPAPGIDPRTRGRFVHLALSELWGVLRDLDGLVALDGAARAAQVRAALLRAAGQVFAGLPERLVQIELDEAARQVAALLEIEAARPAFAVVQREERVDIELGPLRISGRLDRVDRVADGLVIIDYKTGEAGPGNWSGARPAEPQMPLYALAFRAELAALVYASLQPGAVRFKGVARAAEALGDALSAREVSAEEAWQERLDEWRRMLEGLARAFATGDARVDPVRLSGTGSTCARCHLATLCRRDELLRTGALGDD
jgi:ATP-dependent helicase/nuclease subunit B